MVVVRKYPSAFSDPDSAWINESNALGVEDGSCAYGNKHGTKTTNEIILSDFGFDIPDDAIIDDIKIGLISIADNAYYLCSSILYKVKCAVWFDTGIFSWSHDGECLDGGVCSDVTEVAYSVPEAVREECGVDGLNDETFVLSVNMHNASNLPVGNEGYLDAVYIEVTYHLPEVDVEPVMNGLIIAT